MLDWLNVFLLLELVSMTWMIQLVHAMWNIPPSESDDWS